MTPAAGLSGAQKCAILLLLLDEPAAAEVLRRLAADEVRQVGDAMMSVATVEPAAIDMVLDDFLDEVGGVAALGDGGARVRGLFAGAIGEPRARAVLEHAAPPAGTRRFAAFDWAAPAMLAKLIADEHPQAGAVLFANVPRAAAARVFALLPEDRQIDLLHRLARLRPVSPEVLAELEADAEARLADAPEAKPPVHLAGPDFVAGLVNRSTAQARLLDGLRALDAPLADAIGELMFVFADLAGLDQRALQTLLRDIAPETLALALKGADAALRDAVFGAMSARAAAQLQDEIAGMGPVKAVDVQDAQTSVAAVARTLADAGTIALPGRAGAYV